jgi:S-methylmethionine-dependent homocysteine/selenocysteine methylase
MTGLETFLSTNRPYLGDGGMETDLIFNYGVDLPHFSSFVLLSSDEGREALRRYFEDYFEIAKASNRGFLVSTTTWRANAGWADRHVLTLEQLKEVNRLAVDFAKQLRSEQQAEGWALIDGAVGPAGDGYAPHQLYLPEEAEALHTPQMEAFAEAGVDMAIAYTMTHPGEAIGVVRAARAAQVPVGISFTVETDGRLPIGMEIWEAIDEVESSTSGAPLFYGINCAHPTHFMDKLDGAWTGRVGLVRANASCKSHAELDESTELDAGDPEEFGHQYAELFERLPNLRVVDGCCGSDHTHIREIVANI